MPAAKYGKSFPEKLMEDGIETGRRIEFLK
jgi:hypothetical protein